jgi:dihydroxy-acid dehydratase
MADREDLLLLPSTAKGKNAWKPAPRKRAVTTALRSYAAFASSAARGAVRIVPE